MQRKKFVTSCSIVLASVFVLSNANLVSAQETTAETSPVTSETTTPTTSETTAPASETTSASETAPATETVAATETAPATETTTEAPATTEATTSTEEAATTSETATDPATQSDELVILHTNDIHGRLEEDRSVIGVAKLDTIVQETKASNPKTLVLDAGDAFQGLPISNSTKGEAMAEIMNTIGYDAMAVGNHEFDFSFEQAEKYKSLLNFPILSSNTYIGDVRVFDAHTVIDKDTNVEGDEVVVIGVTTPETATKTHPNNIVNVTFTDPIAEVKKVIEATEAQARATGKTYNRYVILAHLGIDDTTPAEWRGNTLAEALSKFTPLANKQVVVIDGHSHSKASTTFGNVAYTQTGSYLNNIGKVTFKANNAIETALITKADTANTTPSERIASLVTAAKEKFDAENSEVYVENNPVHLEGNRSYVRVRETNLGNLVADSLYSYGQTGFSNQTDLAVTNGGGLRDTIQKDAPITKGDVIKVLPFGNIISQITVTGSQIQAMFEHSLSAVLQKDKTTGETIKDDNGQPLLEAAGYFLHISGGRVFFDTNLDPADRILRIEILDKETGKYVPLDLEKTYYLATNDFLAAGGDGYKMLGGAREEGPSMDEVFGNYIKTRDLNAFAEVAPSTRLISLTAEKLASLNTDDLVVAVGDGVTHEVPALDPSTVDIHKNGDGVTHEVPALDPSTVDLHKNGDGVTHEVPAFDLNGDTDGDGWSNRLELIIGTDFLDKSDFPRISVPSTPAKEPATPTPGQDGKGSEQVPGETEKPVIVNQPTVQAQRAGVATLPNTGEAHPIFNAAALAILAGLGLVTVASKRKEIE